MKLLPPGFFNFDVKDTLRLVVWVIIAAFSIGTIYTQRNVDIARLADANVVTNARMDRELKALNLEMNELRAAADRASGNNAAVLAAMEALRTEMRYVNQKIDTLRDDIRANERNRREDQ
jgi:hypothetical protein